MKKIIYILVFVLAGMPAYAGFNGVLTWQTENMEAGENATVTCYIKDKKCRMDFVSQSQQGSSQYSLLFTDESADIIMVSGGSRMIVPISSVPANKYLQNIMMATSTGKTSQVAGYTCAEVKMISPHASIVCLTADIDIQLPSYFQASGAIAALRENNMSGIPLEMHIKDLSGKEVLSQRMISIQAREVEDSYFNL